MKNKKGFTLIEIIVCIGVLAVIGVGSFVGIRYVDNKIKISRLEQITDKAIEAAQVYLETNKESYNQLYNNKNGVSLPLKLLYNEGLLSLENTDLTEDDIEDEYVVTFLGGSGGSGPENCEQITSTASWGNNHPVYLCMNNYKENSNEIVEAAIATSETYFKGSNPNNFVKLDLTKKWTTSTSDNKLFRILSIYEGKTKLVYNQSLTEWERSDVIENKYDSSGSKKESLFQKIKHPEYLSLEPYSYDYSCNGKEADSDGNNDYRCTFLMSTNTSSDNWDYLGTITNYDILSTISNNKTWLGYDKYISGRKVSIGAECVNAACYGGSSSSYYPLITLKKCIKIIKDNECSDTAVVGSVDCPYILKNEC